MYAELARDRVYSGGRLTVEGVVESDFRTTGVAGAGAAAGVISAGAEVSRAGADAVAYCCCVGAAQAIVLQNETTTMRFPFMARPFHFLNAAPPRKRPQTRETLLPGLVDSFLGLVDA